MDQTTRALAVLGIATLMVAPLVNGVLADAAQTADRLFLKDADWDGDPPLPEDYQGDPPEDLPEGDEQRNLTGPAGARPTCQIQEEPTEAIWHHPSVQNDTGNAVAQRASFSNEREFTVEDRHIGLGVRLEITDLRGRFSAQVYEKDNPDHVVFEIDKPAAFGDDVSQDSTETRPELTSGTYVAQMSAEGATYGELTFASILATCAGQPAQDTDETQTDETEADAPEASS